jgi:hypothetical protein
MSIILIKKSSSLGKENAINPASKLCEIEQWRIYFRIEQGVRVPELELREVEVAPVRFSEGSALATPYGKER